VTIFQKRHRLTGFEPTQPNPNPVSMTQINIINVRYHSL
jgi:hypothetical protein